MSEYIWAAAGVAVGVPVALIVGAAVVEATKTAYYRWTYRAIPGPTPGLVGGNLLDFKKAGGAHLALQKWHAQYGPIFKVFAMGKMYVVAADPALARTGMAKMANRPKGFQAVFFLAHGKRKRVMYSTVLMAGDKLWRALRNAWQPAFGMTSLADYASTMTSCADELSSTLTKKLEAAGGGASGGGGGSSVQQTDSACPMASAVVGMDDLYKRMALNVVGTCGYGLRFDALENYSDPQEDSTARILTKACQDVGSSGLTNTKWIFAYSTLPSLGPLIVQLARFFPDAPLTQTNKGIDDLFHYADLLVRNWREGTTTPSGTSPQGAKTVGTPTKESFLARILRAQDQMIKEGLIPEADHLNDLTMAAQASNFIIGGSETSATSMSFATGLIAAHPEVEEKLLQELRAHGLDKPVTPEDLPKFVYLDAILNEALRLFPPVHTTTRDVAKGVDGVTLAGHKLPAGVSVMFPIWTLQRDPKVWGARASEFVPERWLPKDHPDAVSEPVDMNSYMPFGAGARMCPGFKFAIQEVKLTLATLYQKFTFELAPGQSAFDVTCGATLSPLGGLMMHPIPRALTKKPANKQLEGVSKIDTQGPGSSTPGSPIGAVPRTESWNLEFMDAVVETQKSFSGLPC